MGEWPSRMLGVSSSFRPRLMNDSSTCGGGRGEVRRATGSGRAIARPDRFDSLIGELFLPSVSAGDSSEVSFRGGELGRVCIDGGFLANIFNMPGPCLDCLVWSLSTSSSACSRSAAETNRAADMRFLVLFEARRNISRFAFCMEGVTRVGASVSEVRTFSEKVLLMPGVLTGTPGRVV